MICRILATNGIYKPSSNPTFTFPNDPVSAHARGIQLGLARLFGRAFPHYMPQRPAKGISTGQVIVMLRIRQILLIRSQVSAIESHGSIPFRVDWILFRLGTRSKSQ